MKDDEGIYPYVFPRFPHVARLLGVVLLQPLQLGHRKAIHELPQLSQGVGTGRGGVAPVMYRHDFDMFHYWLFNPKIIPKAAVVV